MQYNPVMWRRIAQVITPARINCQYSRQLFQYHQRSLFRDSPKFSNELTTTADENSSRIECNTAGYPDLVVVYDGPLSKSVRLMKLFSISSLAATWCMSPMVFYIDVSNLISDSAKAILIGTGMSN
jgi:hypothetical protein